MQCSKCRLTKIIRQIIALIITGWWFEAEQHAGLTSAHQSSHCHDTLRINRETTNQRMCQTTAVPFSSPCHLPHSKQSATLSSQPFSGRSRSASSVTWTPALRARPGLPVFARSPGTADNLKPGSHQDTPRLAVNRMEFRMT